MSSRRPGEERHRKRRRASVGTKLAVVIVLLMGALSAVVYSGLSRSMSQSLLTSKGETARALARLFSSSVSAAVVFEDAESIEGAIGFLANDPDVLYAGVWAAPKGQIGAKIAEKRIGGREGTSAPRPTREIDLVWLDDVLSASAPIRDEAGRIIAYGLIEFSLADELSRIETIRSRVLMGTVGLAAVVVIMVVAVSRRTIIRPLRRLQAAARRLERGESAEFSVESEDEVGELGDALKQMAEAIEERELEINRRNRDMRLVMDNVGQGFLTLDKAGVITGEHSRTVDEWFGAPRDDERFEDYLARVDAGAADWFGAAWDQVVEGFLPVDLAVEQLPSQAIRDGRTWRLEYRTLLDGEALDKLIIVITDVTSLVETERTEREQREVISALSLMTRDAQGFLEFLEEGEALVAALESGTDDPSLASRQIHTLKGTAAVMQVDSVASACHALEESLMGAQRLPSEEERIELRRVWDGFREKIQPLVAGRHDEAMRIRQDQYGALVEAIRNGAEHDALLRMVQGWTSEETASRLERLAQHAQRLAEGLGKGPLTVDVESDHLHVSPGACGTLWSELVHAVRNAVDHGIESPAERAARNKPTRGRLTLSTRIENDRFVVAVSDDGRGIDWEAVRARAEALGLPHATREQLQSALLHEGLSTRKEATETSGRGLGAAALKATVQRLGGHIELDSSSGIGTTFRIVLPQQVVGAARS